jgi:uncharacterized membrane protein (UPF0127 family)
MTIMVDDTILAHTVVVADHFFTRLRGLLGTKALPEGQALLIRPCNSVHTFFMKYNIDVLFVGKDGQILKIAEDMRPGQIAWCNKGAFVIELPGGTMSKTAVKAGKYLQVK